ncbi:MAG TPA: hypothetical protein VM096_14830 [Vicinamibacterales bacterium]|nr:hypothetical protein [Vicinamibacterales bacterium]
MDPAAAPSVSTLTDFYREEFLKHHKCLQAQREYFSAQAIETAENALLKIIADLDRLTEDANAEDLVAKLLKEFDVVTGLSGRSEPSQVH